MAVVIPLATAQSYTLRTLTDTKGNPWFVAADVRKVLGIASATDTYVKLSPEEITYVGRTHLGMTEGKQMVIISESGLYKLIMRSNKPQAKVFQTHSKVWFIRYTL